MTTRTPAVQSRPTAAWFTVGATLVVTAGAWLSPAHLAPVAGHHEAGASRIAPVALATPLGRPLPANSGADAGNADISNAEVPGGASSAGAMRPAAAEAATANAGPAQASAATARTGSAPEHVAPEQVAPSQPTAATASASSSASASSHHVSSEDKKSTLVEALKQVVKIIKALRHDDD